MMAWSKPVVRSALISTANPITTARPAPMSSGTAGGSAPARRGDVDMGTASLGCRRMIRSR